MIKKRFTYRRYGNCSGEAGLRHYSRLYHRCQTRHRGRIARHCSRFLRVVSACGKSTVLRRSIRDDEARCDVSAKEVEHKRVRALECVAVSTFCAERRLGTRRGEAR